MQYSQEHLKTMVYAEFGGQTECIMGNWKIENNMDTSEKQTLGSVPLGLFDVKSCDAFSSWEI